MANGTIIFPKSSSSGRYIEGKIEWSSSPNALANSSDVTVSLYVKKGHHSQTLTEPTGGSWRYSVSVNGSAVSGTKMKSVLDWTLIYTNTFSGIPHDDDGSKTIEISGSITAPSNTTLKDHTSRGADVVDLDFIPRASSIDSATSVTLGNACSVRWTPKAASFSYRLQFTIGDWYHTTDAIRPNTIGAYTYDEYVIPIDAANQFKTKTGDMAVTLYTYSDADAFTQIGSESTKLVTVTVPDNDDTKPTVSMDLAAVNDLGSSFEGLYIQGMSYLKAGLDVETRYGAEFASAKISVGGFDYVAPYKTDYLTKSGEFIVNCTVTDSRGHSGYEEQSIFVIPYSKPLVQAAQGHGNIVAVRCDSSGNEDSSGTCLKIIAKLTYEKVVSEGVQHNFGKIQYRYRSEGGEWPDHWETVLDTKQTNAVEISTGALLENALSIKVNYQVQVRAVDDISESSPVAFFLPSENVYMDRPAGGRAMGLGGYSTAPDTLDVYWKINARDGLVLFDENNEELSALDLLPFPRGGLQDGWNPDDISNGVHKVDKYSLYNDTGEALMHEGVIIQMAATSDGSVKIQMAFPVASIPLYRIKWGNMWTDWNSFKI